ncbi:hypothetical protein [Chamaesiphon sp. VAR_69_metabat_338]|uniref:hypothetical protein n=1 Tax=Chamaesiphon sp. VAR_69_metabat_338 TaxID=2964704 RepID=UPI00286DDA39|nr:hypothetical protein [Chamaesiphon sp. VAR_69_metabat_338]
MCLYIISKIEIVSADWGDRFTVEIAPNNNLPVTIERSIRRRHSNNGKMETNIKEIISSIDKITTLDSAAALTHLQELVDLYFNHPEAGNYLDVWFRLYERFPFDDGGGIFWTILHGIETYHPTSDRFTIESVLRQPSEFPVMMVNALINGGIDRVGDVNLLELLERLATNQLYSPRVRAQAQGYLDYRQKSKL